LDSKIHTRLAIVTANELGLAFLPRNLHKKIRPDPSTFYLVIVVTDKQTDRQTYAGDSIILAKAFAGIKIVKIERVVPEIILTDRQHTQTHKHTNIIVTVLHLPAEGGVNSEPVLQ